MTEAFKAIDEDGIDSLIGASTVNQPQAASNYRLSIAEFEELDDFLADEKIVETLMDVCTLVGFLTVIAIGPGLILPSEWLL